MTRALFLRALPVLLIAAVSGVCQDAPVPAPKPNPCPDTGGPIDLKGSIWNGWGRDLDNSHYQPNPGFAFAQVSRLKLKWAFAYSGGRANGQPTVVGNRVYVTSESGHVYALNARSGCTYWTFESAPARTAVTIALLPQPSPAKFAAYFGDENSNVYALDALTGKQLWKTQVERHPIARITGAPVFYRGRLYVPVSSFEEVSATTPTYACCTFRGSLVAVDAAGGKVIWQTYVIPGAPEPLRKNSSGTQMYGPAGGGIWSAPTVDPGRKMVYAGTGDSYTDAETKMTDSVVAFDLEKGAVKWFNQITPNDNWVICQGKPGEGNCPQKLGPDFDFGSSLILRKSSAGRAVLLAGQKSGVIFALDPQDRGRILWQVKVGQGGSLGGIEWGIAADEQNVYVPVSDVNVKTDPQPGLTAVQISTGKKLWHVPAPDAPCSWSPRTCSHSQSAAITVVPGVVFSGTMDGHLRAYSTEDGSVVWDFDTAQKAWDAVNGIAARGGVLDASGPTVANGMVYVNSGYGRMPGQPGSVLMAFSVDGK